MIGSRYRVSRATCVRALLSAAGLSAALPFAGRAEAASSPDILTQRSDNTRTSTVADTALSFQPFLDGTWQKLASLPVDGAVYAQPLFVSNQLLTKDGSRRDVVIVATARNTVYAFDANNVYAKLWSVNLGLPDLGDIHVKGMNTAFYDCAEMSPLDVPSSQNLQYGIGVQSTPVIDRSAGPNGRVYVSYRTNTSAGQSDPAGAQQRIAAIDLGSGAIMGDQPVTLGQSARALRQRASLLLSNRVVYLAFGSHCEDLAVPGMKDYDPTGNYAYRGTLVAVDPVTLNSVGRFDTVPATSKYKGGGIWQASTGIAADGNGNLYFTTGNALVKQTDVTDDVSTPNPGPSSPYLPNSFVKLTPSVTPPNTGTVTNVTFSGAASYFTPYRSEWHNRADLDLGSAGVILPNPSEVIGGGKEGVLYVLSSTDLGGYSSQHLSRFDRSLQCAFNQNPDDLLGTGTNWCDSSCSTPDVGADNVLQKWTVGRNIDCSTPNMGNWLMWPHIHGTPSYGNVPFTVSSSGQLAPPASFLYVWPEKDQLQAYKRTGSPSLYSPTPNVANVLAPNRGMPGGMLTLATNSNPASAVLFAAVPLEAVLEPLASPPFNSVNAGGLIALSGIPSADGSLRVLWGDYANDVATSGGPYVHSKFVPPTVADGKVFLATFSDKINVYGVGTAPTLVPMSRIAVHLQDASRKMVTAATVERAGTIAIFGQKAGTSGAWSSGDWGARLATLAGAAFPPGGAVALDTLGSNLALFAVGTDHQLRMYTTSLTGNATSWSGPTVVSPSLGSVTLPVGAPIATVHDGSNLDVFVVDSAGDIRLFTSSASAPWPITNLSQNDMPKFPGDGTGNLAADVQNGSQADVFAVDTFGKLRIYAHGGLGWAGFHPVTNVTMVAGANLATAHRSSNELDVFAIGGAQTFARPSQSCSSTDDAGCLRMFAGVGANPWTETTVPRATNPGQALKTPIDVPPGIPGSPVTAVVQGKAALGPDQIDVFYASQTGTVTLSFYDVNGNWNNVLMVGPPTTTHLFNSRLKAMPGSPIASVSATTINDTISVITPGNRQEPSWTSGVFGAAIINGSAWTNPFKAL